ncbi:MAG: hypothetical protein GXX79_08575 [Actinomycetales bacterium]|nr:hypothetical protein [Actinomycetales bacterium]
MTDILITQLLHVIMTSVAVILRGGSMMRTEGSTCQHCDANLSS